MTTTAPTTIPLFQQPLEPGGIFDARFEHSMNIAQRLHLAMTNVEYVQKARPATNAQGGGLKYSIVTHDAVTALVRAALVKCGIVAVPIRNQLEIRGSMSICQITMRFQNIDDMADFIDVESVGNGNDPGDKGPGKATSYAVKYAYLKALGLETGDDPDLDQDAVMATDKELTLESIVKRLKLELDSEIVIEQLTNGGVREAVAAVSEENGNHAPRLRAEVSAIARHHGVNLKDIWK